MTSADAPVSCNPENSEQKKRKRVLRESSLSEDQKRQNHVSSEQRRRQAMRETYDSLVDIVPDLSPAQSRSELQIYAKSYNYLVWLYERNRALREQLENKMGSGVPQHLVWEMPS